MARVDRRPSRDRTFGSRWSAMTATVDTPALRRLDRLERTARSRPRPASRPSTPSMGYQPGLDGLRAISVIAVICYHAGFGWMHGGFFGVEVFFVVSGFLITSLLIEERERTGTDRAAPVLVCAGRAGCCRRSVPCSSRSRRGRRCSGPTSSCPSCDATCRGRSSTSPTGARSSATCPTSRRRPAAAAAPVEPRRRGAVVPDLAVRVRAADAHAGSPRRSVPAGWSASRSRSWRSRSGSTPVARRCSAALRLFDGVGPHELHVPVDVHPLDRTAARGGGRVRVAAVAYAGRGAARPGTPARRRVRRRDRDARVHLRRGRRSPTATCTSGCCRSCRCCRWWRC